MIEAAVLRVDDQDISILERSAASAGPPCDETESSNEKMPSSWRGDAGARMNYPPDLQLSLMQKQSVVVSATMD